MTFKDKPKRDGGKTFGGDRKPKGPGKPAAEREKKPAQAKAAPASAATAEVVGAGKPERISKIMARAGVASRRDVERMIMEGRVSLNGVLLDTPVVNATLSDKIEVDGMPIRGAERTRLWLYHKPAGLVTTNSDPEGRPTVFDNLPGELPRVLSIGRLDINTEGLLLLTNDGGLSRVLELPTTGWLRRYRVRAHGEVDQAALDKLKDGIAVDGVLYGAIDATLDRTQGHNVWITMGLREGKNREIKNVLGALGLEVNRLIRISYGPFQLGDLPEGKVLEVRGRMLRDQLGPRLIEEAGANFDAPIYNTSVDDEEEAPAKRAKSEWAKSDAPEGRPRFEKAAGKPEDRREKALGRLDTKRSDKPAGKFGAKPAGKFGGKGRNDDEGDDRRPRPPAGTSRTANVWMAPGAKPTRDGKERKSSARAEAESLFKKPSAQDEARRNVVRHADAEGEWIRSDSPVKKKVAADAVTVLAAAKRTLAIAVDAAANLLATDPPATGHSGIAPAKTAIAPVGIDLHAEQRASVIAPHAATNPSVTVRSVTGLAKTAIAHAATVRVARRVLAIVPRVAKSHSANARSVTSPAKREIVPAVIVRAVTGLSATSPEAVNPAAGPHRASRPSANPASVANAPVFRARVKAPVAMAPAAASRAAKARVANLLVAGE